MAAGVHLWDVDGRKYYDFLSAYSAVNLGHCPDSLIHVMTNQAKRLHLTSRAFMNDQLGPYEKYVCGLLGYGGLMLSRCDHSMSIRSYAQAVVSDVIQLRPPQTPSHPAVQCNRHHHDLQPARPSLD